MIMHVFNEKQGQSLIEILLAVAVFTLGVVTIGFLVLESFASMRFAQDSVAARLLAQEGLEAVRAIRDDSYGLLEAGMYGLARTDAGWEFTSSSDTYGKFQRSVILTQASEEVFEVTSLVQWDNSELSLSTSLSNWRQNAGEAGDIAFDLNNAALISSSTQLYGIALINTGTLQSTVTDVHLQFEGGGSLLSISLGGESVFAASSSSAPVSGERIDITDYMIAPSSGYHLFDAYFVESVDVEEAVVTLIFADGSAKHARVSF